MNQGVGRDAVTRGAVLVTGASSGIGQACALHLDQAGYHVFASALSLEDGAQTKQLASARLELFALDITSADSIAQTVATLANAVGEAGLCGLVNNAGVLHCAPLELLEMDAVRHVFEVNVFGHIALTQALLPLLRRSQSYTPSRGTFPARIVNIGSLAGRSALPFTSPYNASKFALRALSDTWRLELRRQGIAVVLVEPGMVMTPIWQKSSESVKAQSNDWSPEVQDLYPYFVAHAHQAARIAQQKGVSPTQVAQVVLRAMRTARPRAHYSVGRETRLLMGVEALPTRLRDWLIARRFSL